MSSSIKPKKPQLIMAIAAMASGMALVVTILTKASLALTLSCLGILAVLTAVLKWSSTPVQTRPFLKAQVLTGIGAGFIATLAYDLSRLLIVTIGGLKFWPFETLVLFGHLIIGESASRTAAYIAGTVYHLLNGILFAVAYCFVFSNRNWKYAILWALGLEAGMFTLYPGWLDLKAVMKEFTIVSVSGHIIYGSILGILTQRWLKNFKLNREKTNE